MIQETYITKQFVHLRIVFRVFTLLLFFRREADVSDGPCASLQYNSIHLYTEVSAGSLIHQPVKMEVKWGLSSVG